MKTTYKVTKKRSQVPSRRPEVARPIDTTALAQAVIRIAKINSEIATISKQLRSLERQDGDSQPADEDVEEELSVIDDVLKEATATNALLDAFDLDDEHGVFGERKKTRKLQCPAELQEQRRKLQRLPQLGRLVRLMLQQQYPLTWERLLQS